MWRRLIEICRQRWLFAFLLSQGGEFAFVVFGVARAARLFTAEWEALLTITVALSMATTPLLLLAHDRLMGSPRAGHERRARHDRPTKAR